MAKKETNGEIGQGAGQSDLERLADIILSKQGGGNVVGGKPFIPLSAEEVAKLPKKTMEETAAEYFGTIDLTNFPWPGIHVSSDLQIFMGHVSGENARDNHVAANKSGGMTFQSFPKPQ